ncbi:MAG: glycosyltransferase family 4 protein [Croceibacterium sp.]
MRLIFVNRFFWPDHSATSQILSDVAFALAARGYRVEVVASRSNYSDVETVYPANGMFRAVRIHRVSTTRFGRATLLGRAMDYISFYFGAVRKVAALLLPGDILIVKTDPPLMSVVLGLVARLKGARQINWLQDVYPETAAALGIRLAGGLPGHLLRQLRNRSLKRSDAQVVLGSDMRRHLIEQGIDAAKVQVIPNFSDDEAIVPQGFDGRALRAEWGYSEKQLVIGYSGNLGRAHDLDTLMDAARILQDRKDTDIRFLFIGGGALIARACDDQRLNNIQTRPYQPREMLSESLAVPDVHVISLKDEVHGYVFPSKYYGILSAGRPILYIGSPDSELAREIAAADIGRAIPIGASSELVEYLLSLKGRREKLESQGRRARALMDSRYRRELAIERWDMLVQTLGNSREEVH